MKRVSGRVSIYVIGNNIEQVYDLPDPDPLARGTDPSIIEQK